MPRISRTARIYLFRKRTRKNSSAGDLKEFWQIGQTIEDGEVVADNYPANVKVKEIAAFNDLGYNLYRGFEKSGRSLLQSLALFWG